MKVWRRHPPPLIPPHKGEGGGTCSPQRMIRGHTECQADFQQRVSVILLDADESRALPGPVRCSRLSAMPLPFSLARFTAVALAALVVCAVLLPGVSIAQAQASRAATEAQFRDWVAQIVWPDAQKQGVSRETFERSLSAK